MYRQMMEPRRIVNCKIPAGVASGLTVLDYLSRRFTYRNRGEWQKVLAAGKIVLGEQTSSGAEVLKGGEILHYYPGELAEPEVNEAYRIIYEDDNILLIDKPGNLPMHPAGRYFKHTLWYLLNMNGSGEFFPVNRLDRATCGLVLWAKNKKTAQFFGNGKNIFTKQYYGMVNGRFPASGIRASGFLSPDEHSAIRKKRKFTFDCPNPNGEAEQNPVACSAGKKNKRRGKVECCDTNIEFIAGNVEKSLLRFTLFSGRTHQIRATMCSLGFPLCGDEMYGVDESLFLRRVTGTPECEETECESDMEFEPENLCLQSNLLEIALPGGERERRVFSLEIPPEWNIF